MTSIGRLVRDSAFAVRFALGYSINDLFALRWSFIEEFVLEIRERDVAFSRLPGFESLGTQKDRFHRCTCLEADLRLLVRVPGEKRTNETQYRDNTKRV